MAGKLFMIHMLRKKKKKILTWNCNFRFTAFLNQERERRVILAKNRNDGTGWIYFTHCTALCVFLAIAICSAPLLYDYSVVYRGSLDGAILACIVSTVFHLFLWFIFWVFLTMKQRWTFKLRVTIGRATVRSARYVYFHLGQLLFRNINWKQNCSYL